MFFNQFLSLFCRHSIALNHCFINIVDVCFCFIVLVKTFIDKIKRFRSSIYLSLILWSLCQIMSFAFFFTLIDKLSKEKINATKSCKSYYCSTNRKQYWYHFILLTLLIRLIMLNHKALRPAKDDTQSGHSSQAKLQ